MKKRFKQWQGERKLHKAELTFDGYEYIVSVDKKEYYRSTNYLFAARVFNEI